MGIALLRPFQKALTEVVDTSVRKAKLPITGRIQEGSAPVIGHYSFAVQFYRQRFYVRAIGDITAVFRRNVESPGFICVDMEFRDERSHIQIDNIFCKIALRRGGFDFFYHMTAVS